MEAYQPTRELLESLRMWPFRSWDNWVWSGRPVLILMLPHLRLLSKATGITTQLAVRNDQELLAALITHGWIAA